LDEKLGQRIKGHDKPQANSAVLERSAIVDMNPIVIGGSGGSGTRAVARFLAAIGVQMGEHLNGSADALAFVDTLDALISPILQNTRSLDYDPNGLPVDLVARAVEMIHSAADSHCAPSDRGGRWGFKNPRHMFLLPILNRTFPEFVFVHVLRDGRDMLFSDNQNQLRRYYSDLFGRPRDVTLEAAAAFWSMVNLQTASYSARVLKSRYMLLRLEDFCGEARQDYVLGLVRKLELDEARAVSYLDIFRAPTSLGRWRERVEELPALTGIFGTALGYFGYY
jgi:Sulfotransferase family